MFLLQVGYLLVALYDATYVYVVTLNDTLTNNENYRNGSRFLELVRGTSFKGIRPVKIVYDTHEQNMISYGVVSTDMLTSHCVAVNVCRVYYTCVYIYRL